MGGKRSEDTAHTEETQGSKTLKTCTYSPTAPRRCSNSGNQVSFTKNVSSSFALAPHQAEWTEPNQAKTGGPSSTTKGKFTAKDQRRYQVQAQNQRNGQHRTERRSLHWTEQEKIRETRHRTSQNSWR